jgi:transcriptional regulator with XRE-family HTH domain
LPYCQAKINLLSIKKTILSKKVKIYIVFKANALKSLRQLLAFNMKENRGRLRISQAKLAERAGLSTQYIAMIELARKFPAPEMLEKIANALEIDPPELFSMPTAEGQVRKLQKTVLLDIEQAVAEAVTQVVERNLARLEADEDCK